MLKKVIFCLTVMFSFNLSSNYGFSDNTIVEWNLNTSNPGKLREFQRIFDKHQILLSVTDIDLEEIDSDPINVVAHKASQFNYPTLVEDTSLDVEGEDVGVNVKWLIDNLSMYEGKKAKWKALLGYRVGDYVVIYQGEVEGKIVKSSAKNTMGFDAVFMPNGSDKTLEQYKPDQYNARALAIESLVNNNIYVVVKALDHWDGQWQAH